MSFGAERTSREDLALSLSAGSDCQALQSSFDTAFCESGAFQLSRGDGPSVDDPRISSLGDFGEDFTIFDAVAEDNEFENVLLDGPVSEAVRVNAGTPWPTPYSPPSFMTGGGKAIASKDLGVLGAHDWDFQADHTRQLTTLSGLGASGSEDDLFFNQPTTGSLEGLGAFAQAQPNTPRAQAYKTVVVAAATAGGEQAAKVARELLKKSVKLAELSGDRAEAVKEAREGFVRSLKEVEALDKRAKILAAQLLDEKGEPLPGITLADVQRLKQLRARAISLGRRAVRYQKVNALATPLADNGIAQTAILQALAAAILTGNVGSAAALGAMYDEIGKKSTQIRGVREKQLSKWQNKEALGGLQSIVSFGDPYEAELNGIELDDLAFFADLEFRLFKRIKKAFKKVKRKVKKAVKKVGRGIKRGVSKAGRGIVRGARKVGRGVRSAAFTVGRVGKAVGKVVGKISKATLYTPIAGSVKAIRRAAKGDIRGAFREVGRAVKSVGRDIKDATTKIFVDWPCQVMESKIAQTAIRAAGQAVGTVYGGALGGAVGGQAAKAANNINKGMCGGLKKIGIRDGKFHPRRIKSAFKQAARGIYKSTFSPKALLAAGASIAGGALTGGAAGGASGLLNQFGAKALKNVGASQLQGQLKNRLVAEAKKRGRRYLQKQVTRLAPKSVRNLVQAGVSIARDPSSIATQAQRAVSRAPSYAQRYARRRVTRAVRRAVPGSSRVSQSNLLALQRMARSAALRRRLA